MVSNRSSSAFGGSPHGTFVQRWLKKQDVDKKAFTNQAKKMDFLLFHSTEQEKKRTYCD
jgi:hypothetical protein